LNAASSQVHKKVWGLHLEISGRNN